MVAPASVVGKMSTALSRAHWPTGLHLSPAEDVVNLNALFHGPTAYVVAQSEEVLQARHYVKGADAGSSSRRLLRGFAHLAR